MANQKSVFALLAVLLIAAAAYYLKEHKPEPAPESPADGYLFCFWNVENLFDDKDDSRVKADEKYDNEFANDPELRNTKYRNLSKVLLAMNGGKGPDILAVAEVESERAAELLLDRLNKDLPAGAAPYNHCLFIEQKQGRHIAPAILTRLPVKGDRTKQVGKHHHRILRGQIEVENQPLTIMVGHWKSRVKTPGSHKDDAEGRADYGNAMFGEFKAMFKSNPAVDLLLCGDFNDDPDDDSVVKHLHATADRSALTTGSDPMLFNLAAGRDRNEFGTLWHSRWHQFDQICVSPGLLDEKGWSCKPDTFKVMREKTANRKGRPWRFEDDANGHHTKDNAERGFSDHFPVTVRLKVRPD